jgi:hypothetical protein
MKEDSVYTLLIIEEKHHSEYFLIAEGKLEDICREILESRVESGIWYDDETLKEAEKVLETGKTKEFLFSRQNYEYEYIDHRSFENV